MNENNPIIYIARISENAVFAIAKTEYIPMGKELITLDGLAMDKPYLVAKLHSLGQGVNATMSATIGAAMLGMILHLPENNLINAVENVVFINDKVEHNFSFSQAIDDNLSQLERVFKQLAPSDVAKILYLLLQFSNARPSLMLSKQYWLICNKVRQFLRPSELQAKNSVWLLPNLLFIPANLPDSINWLRAKLMLCSEHGLRFNEVTPVLSPCGNEAIGLLVQFANAANAMRPDESMTLLLRDQAITIASSPPAIKDLSESKINVFIAYLGKQNEAKIFAIRGGLSKAISSLAPTQELTNIIKTLQLYLPSMHSSVADFTKPFGLNIEVFAPISGAGLLISGWLFDPMELLAHVSITDDCGNYYANQTFTHRFVRNDVEKLYEDSPYAVQGSKQGFMLWLDNANAHTQPCAIRMDILLKSGLSYAITSATKPANAVQMRQDLLKMLGLHLVNHPAEMQFLAEKLGKLQQNITTNISKLSPQIEHFGKAPNNPIYSIIIPLYKRLEFVQAQIASFSADKSLAKAEIIYVLDSPNQAEFLRKKLEQFSSLYNVAITLLVMPENAGYAMASNAGAKIARGEWLVLMNSDILPQSQNWAQLMSNFLLENPKIGVVAPKLLYEDDSIQHAGMFFAHDARGRFYENKHYYKGFPSGYAPANKSRTIPAVSAACIMINRKLFAKMGMFATSFVVGDYEDSDLCLKLLQKGYHSFYISEVQMLHFERQSMSEHETATTTARYYVNAMLHQQKWGAIIDELMLQYDGAKK